MKEMILRAVDLKKNGESFPLMGVVGGEMLEDICEITLAEDSSISIDLGGDYKKIIMDISPIGLADNLGVFTFNGKTGGAYVVSTQYSVVSRPSQTISTVGARIELYLEDGYIKGESYFCYDQYAYGIKYGVFKNFGDSTIKSFVNGKKYLAGTKFKIRGVRA